MNRTYIASSGSLNYAEASTNLLGATGTATSSNNQAAKAKKIRLNQLAQIHSREILAGEVPGLRPDQLLPLGSKGRSPLMA